MILQFSIIIITYRQWNPLIYGILAFPSIFISMIISSILCSRNQNISITDGIITVNNKKTIQIDSIDWYFNGENFFFDGIRIKTKQKRNYFFATINFIKKDSNFDVFKSILNRKSVKKQIQVKTSNDLIRDSKSLRFGSTIALIFLAAIILITLITDIKIDAVKIIYVSLIIIGTLIGIIKVN
jgi:hypothetical protein